MKFFQSPPELGDLGGFDQSQRRQLDQLDLCVRGSFLEERLGYASAFRI